MNRIKTISAAALVLLLAAACGSTGGGLGDIFGSNSNRSYDIRGTVDSVDLNSRSIYLTNVTGYTNGLASGVNNTARVFYDDRTTVQYQGRTYRPADLERGDQVSVRADQNGNQLLAQSMDVTYNAGGMASSTGPHGSTSVIHGTIRSIDRNSQSMTLDRGYSSSITIDVGTNTPVDFNGRTYHPTDLQVGDEIDVHANDLGGGRFSAQDITVTRSATSTGTNTSSSIHGTVRYIDPSTRTILIENPTWTTRFQTGTGSNTMTIHYDPNFQVDYQGQQYPVANLEPGDVVDVQLQNSGGTYYTAQRITVVRNVNAR